MSEQTLTMIAEMQNVAGLLRPEEIDAAASALFETLHNGGDVYTFGNGGSASTASHLVVDLSRINGGADGSRWRITSLTDNVAWLTAVSNDQDYAECFAEPLRVRLNPGDLVIGISASGDSENVVRGFEVARAVGANRLAMIGFDGGRLASMATHRIWIDSHDYGIVESLHLFAGHMLVRLLRAGIAEATSREGDFAQVSADARCGTTPVNAGPIQTRDRDELPLITADGEMAGALRREA